MTFFNKNDYGQIGWVRIIQILEIPEVLKILMILEIFDILEISETLKAYIKTLEISEKLQKFWRLKPGCLRDKAVT